MGQLHGFHQAVHSADTDMDAIITGKNMSDFVSADPLAVVRVDAEDEPPDLLVLDSSCSRSRMKMFVVGAAVYVQDTAQGFDGVLTTEPVDRIQSLLECGVNMAIAFFKIRFSSSSWALRF